TAAAALYLEALASPRTYDSRMTHAISPLVAAHVLVGFLFAFSGCSTMPAADPRIDAERNRIVIESSIRTDQDRRMDAARHPAEFLPFTKVKPGMQVLDVSTGAGYTSQLLALAVGPLGGYGRSRRSPAQRSPNGLPISRR